MQPSTSLQIATTFFGITTKLIWYTLSIMFIKVRLLNGYQELLWYKKPHEWPPQSLIGSIVHVPLKNQRVAALVIAQQSTTPAVPFTIKEALHCEQTPPDKQYQPFIEQLSSYYQTASFHFIKRIKQFLMQKETKEIRPVSLDVPDHPAVTLTTEQEQILSALLPLVQKPRYQPSVLHGVTGSGKTEIYKQLMLSATETNKSALLLLPEVSLALELERRLKAELPATIPLYSFHSATPTKQKRLLWQQLIAQKPVIIIGVHLPVLLPIANLGLIIVDEEHDVGYQEKKHPKVNSKEAALMRAQLYNIPIILGSATPSIASLYNVKKKQWQFFQLKNRFAGNFPTIKTVLLTDGKERKQFWISKQLYSAINDRLSKREQTIIFLNRRGHSFFVQCASCSFIIQCPSCSVSLTLHNNNTLICHYCSYTALEPTACPACKKTSFLRKGIGTQQVVTILKSLYPHARIERADLDTSANKKLLQQIMQDMHEGAIDILVGTQTITKGYHFPRVTLVGILWADLNLNFPIFNAAETSLQQLIQVAGRAGRQSEHSEVIVQAMRDHTVFSYVHELNYLQFYQHELEHRQLLGYPPSKRLVEIELKHPNEATVEQEAHKMAANLLADQQRHQLSMTILGPAKPIVHKIKNMFSRKIYIKAPQMNDIVQAYQKIDQKKYLSSIFFSPNPLQ